MKKKLALTIILIVAFAAIAVIAFAVANNLDKFFDIDKTADVGETDEKAPDTSDNTVYLEEYWSEKAQNSSPSLKELYAECEALVRSGKKIIFEKDMFTEHYSKNCYKGSSLTGFDDSKIVIESKNDSSFEDDTYVIFLATLTTCFENYFYYRDYDYSNDYDRQRDTSFFCSADFGEFGYSSAEDYYNAVCNGECQWSDESYNISFAGKHIVSAQDNGASENLYEAIKAK